MLLESLVKNKFGFVWLESERPTAAGGCPAAADALSSGVQLSVSCGVPWLLFDLRIRIDLFRFDMFSQLLSGTLFPLFLVAAPLNGPSQKGFPFFPGSLNN